MGHSQELVILGSVGNCIDILDLIYAVNQKEQREVYRCVAFLDDNPGRHGLHIHGVPVVGDLSKIADFPDAIFSNGIGSSANYLEKQNILGKLSLPTNRWATLVHPSASVAFDVVTGPGTVLFSHVSVTTGVKIGSHVSILPNAVVSHDAQIGDHTIIAGGAMLNGGVRVGANCYVGANACIRQYLRIGEGCLIGMGAVVVKDVDPFLVVAGNPARFLKKSRGR